MCVIIFGSVRKSSHLYITQENSGEDERIVSSILITEFVWLFLVNWKNIQSESNTNLCMYVFANLS